MTAPASDAAGLHGAVATFLAHEGMLVDLRRWADWLALFEEDAVFRIPARTVDGEYGDDPEESINLIYLIGRESIGNRISRIESGGSAANTPLPMTCHVIGSVIVEPGESDLVLARSAAVVTAVSPLRGVHMRSGRYEHLLRPDGGSFRVLRKTVFLLDEVIDGFLDVHLV